MTTARRFLTLVLISLAAAGLWRLLDQPGYSTIGASPNDNLLYWAAGKALRAGLNPYSQSEVTRIALTSVGVAPETPAYYPPWSLPLFVVFSEFDYSAFRKLWFITSAALVFLSINLSRGSNEWSGSHARAFIVLISFFPFYLMLYLGQFTSLPLLFFVLYQRRRPQQDFISGLLLAGSLFKPNLFILVLVSELWAMLASRRWISLAGFGAAGMVLLLLPLYFNPGVYRDWLAAPAAAMATWKTPNLGGWLTMLDGRAWLRFIPLAVTLPLMLFLLMRRRPRFSDSTHFAALPGLNLVVTPYVWTHDFVMLLPLISRLAGRSVSVDAALIAANALLWIRGESYHYDVWHPIAVLGICYWAGAFSRRTETSSS